MPVTRSSSHQPRPHPFPSSSPPRSQSPNATTPRMSSNDTVFHISSSVGKTSKRKNEKPRSRILPTIIEPEIIEISSGDESPPPRSKPTTTPVALPPEPAVIAEFRRQISRYREEAAKSKKDLQKISKEAVELREENQELQKLRNAGDGKISLDTNHLRDLLECEICTTRMWTPYILPNCGHTFCQFCLQDWFGTTQAQFMANNPGYNPNQLISNQNFVGLYNVAQAIMRNPHTANSPQVSALVAQLLPPCPRYTCPTCREIVTLRPTEDFALKALLRTITTAMGENSPKKAKPLVRGPSPNPWVNFFPFKTA